MGISLITPGPSNYMNNLTHMSNPPKPMGMGFAMSAGSTSSSGVYSSSPLSRTVTANTEDEAGEDSGEEGEGKGGEEGGGKGLHRRSNGSAKGKEVDRGEERGQADRDGIGKQAPDLASPLASPIDLTDSPSANNVPWKSSTSGRQGAPPITVTGFKPSPPSNLQSTPSQSSVSTISSQKILATEGRRSSLTQSLRLHSLPPPPHFQPSSATLPLGTPPRDLSSLYEVDPLSNNRPKVNSAPSTPAASGILHPSAYIHTHHPRRASLTPLNLNTISPVPPSAQLQAIVRRESQALSAGGDAMSTYSGIRRKSLSPSIPTIAQASPTKIQATGMNAKKFGDWSFAGGPAATGSTSRSITPERRRHSLRPAMLEGLSDATIRPSSSKKMQGMPASAPADRRASQPAGQGLAKYAIESRRRSSAQEGAEGSTAYPTEGMSPTAVPFEQKDFKFGESSLTGSRSRTPSVDSRTSPSNSTGKFSDTESVEAEKQRIAFMTSTYGNAVRPSVKGTEGRKASLLGNEGYRRGSLGIPGYEDMSPGKSPKDSFISNSRRGSIPINVPVKKGSGADQVAQRLREAEFPRTGASHIDEHTGDPPHTSQSQGEGDTVRRTSLSRPLPPLMPLSDPGPRLLPSTMALHRANHLLQSKKLESEPMPHPLPPSLHPPPPVDMMDFDIDFILAGASTPDDRSIALGTSAPSALSGVATGRKPVPSTLKLGPGGDDEDTFAKFVGAFDEEYDDRRDEWTFKACAAAVVGKDGESRSQGDSSAEWECLRAGKYCISPNGEIRSKQSGKTWRILKGKGREYEVSAVPTQDEQAGPPDSPSPLSDSWHSYVLASKVIHNELGGVKLLHKSSRVARPRMESADSALTAHLSRLVSPLQKKPQLPTIGGSASDESTKSSPLPNRGRAEKGLFLHSRRGSRSVEPNQGNQGTLSHISHALLGSVSSVKDPPKREKKDKEKHSIGEKIKKTWLAGLNRHADEKRERKEERQQREREKAQSQSWSGASSHSSAWSHGSDGVESSSPGHDEPKELSSSLTNDVTLTRPTWTLRQQPTSSSDPKVSTRPETSEDGHLGLSFKEGKAWEAVPDDAIAMVLPLSSLMQASAESSQKALSFRQSSFGSLSFFDVAPAQSLLVYYVPFTSTPSDERPGSVNRRSSFSQRLRRAKSKDKVVAKAAVPDMDGKSLQLHPLPFRSFRIVARVVEPEDLRSEPDVPQWPEWQNQPPTTSPEPPSLDLADSPQDAIGNKFPTVIGVCHSRGQGVEFVLEGLDRLGLCDQSQASWGPTGYEEYRSHGLSQKGRELLDLLFVGSICCLGLTSS